MPSIVTEYPLVFTLVGIVLAQGIGAAAQNAHAHRPIRDSFENGLIGGLATGCTALLLLTAFGISI